MGGRIDDEAVRNTRDVDLLVRRADFAAARTALATAGFVYHHLRDTIQVGLIDATWPARLQPPLGERLQQLLYNPNGKIPTCYHANRRQPRRHSRCPVAWPQATDYNEAIQNARLCFQDPELQSSQVVVGPLGMPTPYSGNFADVYEVSGPTGQKWAVKCFTREVGSRQSRYQAISNHLGKGSPSFMVQFQYLTDGIRIRGKWYPVLKMDWVHGFTLNEFVSQHAHRPAVMYRLAKLWVKLSLQLRRANMVHADLQHGNVLLVPGEKAAQLSLRLIDYDGMYIPALANAPSGEVGHPNYQHPQRLAEGIYTADVDRFPHLLIYTALRCLTVGGRELWEKHDNGENLLFREQDFALPTESKLLLDLWQLPDPDIRILVGHLLIGSQMPLDRVPMLDEIVGSLGRPLSLTAGQERHVMDFLPPGASRVKTPPATVSMQSLEELVASMDDQPLGAPADGFIAKVQASGGMVDTAPAHQASPAATPAASTTRRPVRAPLFLPWLRLPCPRCGETKHLLESICPHCKKADYISIASAAAVAVVFLIGACVGLPIAEPEIAGVIHVVCGIGAVVTVPVAVGLGIHALLWHLTPQPDNFQELRWPAVHEVCLHCSGVNFLPLVVCRLCGRLSWVRLAMLCTLAMTAALIVVAAPSDPDAALWWQIVAKAFHWLGRVVAAAAAFTVFLGTFEAWRLQPRLPKERRIRTQEVQFALAAAAAVPIICVVLLVLGLYSR